MKKGIWTTVIGFALFYLVTNVIFRSDSSIAKVIPSVFFMIVAGGIFSKVKKTANDQKGKEKPYISSLESKSEDNKESKYTDQFGNEKASYSKRCKKCNALISGDDAYCPECGASQKNTIICEYCGHENPASNALCEKCNGFL